MKTLLSLKKDIAFDKDMALIVGTSRDIALGDFYALVGAQKKRFASYLEAFAGFFRMVNEAGIDSPLVNGRGRGTAILSVTSDEGLTGGMHRKTIDEALSLADSIKDGPVLHVVIGSQGATIVGQHVRDFVRLDPPRFESVSKDEKAAEPSNPKEHQPHVLSVAMEDVVAIADRLSGMAMDGKFSRLFVVCPRGESISRWEVEVRQLLPAADLASKDARDKRDPRKTIVESPPSDIAQYLVSQWLCHGLLASLEDARLAELAARASRMNAAEEHLKKELGELKEEYAKTSRNLIDKALRELNSSKKLADKKKELAHRKAKAAKKAAMAAKAVDSAAAAG